MRDFTFTLPRALDICKKRVLRIVDNVPLERYRVFSPLPSSSSGLGGVGGKRCGDSSQFGASVGLSSFAVSVMVVVEKEQGLTSSLEVKHFTMRERHPSCSIGTRGYTASPQATVPKDSSLRPNYSYIISSVFKFMCPCSEM